MERNNGRYPYIRRQGSGGHNALHSYHHHHNNNNSNSNAAPAGNQNQNQNMNVNPNANVNMNANMNMNMNTNMNASGYGGYSGPGNSNSGGINSINNSNSAPLSQHDELIRYIREAWNKVYEQGTPVFCCNESDNQLKNFKPFNLEEYWGQRLVQNIHVSSTQAGGHQ